MSIGRVGIIFFVCPGPRDPPPRVGKKKPDCHNFAFVVGVLCFYSPSPQPTHIKNFPGAFDLSPRLTFHKKEAWSEGGGSHPISIKQNHFSP